MPGSMIGVVGGVTIVGVDGVLGVGVGVLGGWG